MKTPAPEKKPSKAADFGIQAPSLNLPKGGGAIAGMGEKFAANPVTASASFSVPLPFSPARGGTPDVALHYDSGSGNGVFGLGWQLSLPAVSRKTHRGLPRYRDGKTSATEDQDTFLLTGQDDLVPGMDPPRTETENSISYTVFRYLPRVTTGLIQIERWDATSTGVSHWRVRDGHNRLRIFGQSASAQIANPAQPTQIASWFLELEQDEVGNVIRYGYQAEDRRNVPACPSEGARIAAPPTNTYLKRIEYGNRIPGSAEDFCFELVFDLGDHDPDDPQPDDTLSWPARRDPFSSFRTGFEVRCERLCRRVLLFHRFPELGTRPTLVRSLEFTYTENARITTLASVQGKGWRWENGAWTTQTLPPLSFTWTEAQLDPTVRFVEGLDDLPMGLDTRQWQFVDLDGEGLTGLLAEQGGAWWYRRNEGAGQLAAPNVLGARPALDFARPDVQLTDVQGDGKLELLWMGTQRGFFARNDRQDWTSFRPFLQGPAVNLQDPDTRLIDVDGDGRPELVIWQGNRLIWFDEAGEKGFAETFARVWFDGEENQTPKRVFSDSQETLFIADMTGDGLPDLVQIRYNTVCYWPNLGHGRFGARRVLSNAPLLAARNRFDPQRVRWVDVDGTGPADLLYLGEEGVRFWYNAAGNSLVEGGTIPFPPTADPAQVQAIDLRGEGTACLVWSSPLGRDRHAPLRYIRLQTEKPFLLKKLVNHLGRETRLSYTPSTTFYIQDRRQGRPWATRLPFVVACLSKVETVDALTGWKFVQTYTYHHGAYDGVEREFRGFARVDQRDTERFADFEDPAHANSSQITHVPPVVTKSWFHTGIWRAPASLDAVVAEEGWNGDPQAASPGAHTFPTGLSVSARKDALRALKGQLLRQEIFSEDESAHADAPYQVTQTRLTVRQRQAATEAHPAVFEVLPPETLVRSYERSLDPRVTHTLPLVVDATGTPLVIATVQYPRRNPAFSFQAPTICVVQAQTVLHDDVANRLHLAVPLVQQSWSLSGLEGDDQAPFSATDLRTAWDASENTSDRTLLSEVRTTYWADDLSGPASGLESRALVYEKYQLIALASQTSALCNGNLTSSLVTEAGYLDLDSNGDLWQASGRQTLDPNAFFLSTAVRDPFGNTTALTWDAHLQQVLAVTHPVGLTVSLVPDYRVLQPATLTDPNGTVQSATYDALGRLTATALTGRLGEGDTLAVPTLTASYAPERWMQEGKPAKTVVMQRENYNAANSRWQTVVAFSDGGGNLLQEKRNAAPGLAPERDANGNLVFANGVLQWAAADPRWIGSGRTVVNNKGKPIRQYEPFFSASDDYEWETEIVEWGVSPLLHYDPLGRVIQTDLPDGTFTKVLFDGWKQETWDAHDTVLESSWYTARMSLANGHPDRRAALLAATHANTPTRVHLDAMGRPVRTEAFLTETAFTTDAPDAVTEVTLDIVGNPLSVTDARNVGIQTQAFDAVGRPWKTHSPDGGDTWMLPDGADAPIRVWKSGALTLRFGYDAARRKTRQWVTEGTASERLVERVVYGDALPNADALAVNAKGRVYRLYDTAGVVTTEYDFAGNPVSSERSFWSDPTTPPDWSALDAVSDPEDPADLETAATAFLESEAFSTTQTFDALQRVVTRTTPDTSVTTFGFSDGGTLESAQVQLRGSPTVTPLVTALTHNARGQREQIDLGSGISTVYTHDPLTFRLTRLVTTRSSDHATLQDLTFTYDAVGNLVRIFDDAQDTLFFANQAVKPEGLYEYDAFYRLTFAQGREKSSLGLPGWQDAPQGTLPDLATAVWAYEQVFSYDAVGNLLAMDHTAVGQQSGHWIRNYAYEEAGNVPVSNRLVSTSVGQNTEHYAYSDRGHLVNAPWLVQDNADNVLPDFRDQVWKARLNGSGDEAFYLYDAAGQRVLKRWAKGGIVEERRYLGTWEVWRKSVAGALTEERETLHGMDDQRRIVLLETKTVDSGNTISNPTTVQRFQLGNQIGSACLEVDEDGSVISYEEFHPFGTTSWWATDSSVDVSPKRYRYTGMERDEETGLQCHGVRFYAVWLGRWISADPIGLGDGVNRFAYCHNAPTGGRDPSGLGDEEGLEEILDPKQSEVDSQTVAEVADNTISKYYNFFKQKYNIILESSKKEVYIFANNISIEQISPQDFHNQLISLGIKNKKAIQFFSEKQQSAYEAYAIAKANNDVDGLLSSGIYAKGTTRFYYKHKSYYLIQLTGGFGNENATPEADLITAAAHEIGHTSLPGRSVGLSEGSAEFFAEQYCLYYNETFIPTQTYSEWMEVISILAEKTDQRNVILWLAGAPDGSITNALPSISSELEQNILNFAFNNDSQKIQEYLESHTLSSENLLLLLSEVTNYNNIRKTGALALQLVQGG